MRAQTHAIVILLSVLLVACGDAPDSSTAQTMAPAVAIDDISDTELTNAAAQRKMVVLGDSLSAGFGLQTGDALPAKLEARLADAGITMAVINAGVSGDTSANGLARYDWSVASVDPDFLIIALGANDYLLGLSPDLTRENLTTLIERAQSDGISVILAGLDPRTQSRVDSREAAFARLYPDLAATYDVPLYPALLEGVRDNAALLQVDGLHPNRAGVERMADQFADFLAPLLSEPSD